MIVNDNELKGTRARTDHGNPLALQIMLVLPARRMKGNALEALSPRDVREARPVEIPFCVFGSIFGARGVAACFGR